MRTQIKTLKRCTIRKASLQPKLRAPVHTKPEPFHPRHFLKNWSLHPQHSLTIASSSGPLIRTSNSSLHTPLSPTKQHCHWRLHRFEHCHSHGIGIHQCENAHRVWPGIDQSMFNLLTNKWVRCWVHANTFIELVLAVA
jgi:hypothetical protein